MIIKTSTQLRAMFGTDSIAELVTHLQTGLEADKKVGFCAGTTKLLLCVLLLSTASAALSANALLEFSESLESFRADFTQTVYDADSIVLQESSGDVVLARPGRFKWTYSAPVNQVIVADGLTLWVYDEEIKQVTKQPQSTTLGSAPIGLLSGRRDIESEFVIEELGEKDSLEWFQLKPLVSDTDFNEIFIALKDGALLAMELRDNFDQATQIVFANFQKNIPLQTDQFSFEVPESVDVVGEGGVPELQVDQLPEALPSDSTDPAPHAGIAPATELPLSEPSIEADPLLDDITTNGSASDVKKTPTLTTNTSEVPNTHSADHGSDHRAGQNAGPATVAPVNTLTVVPNSAPYSDDNLLGGETSLSTDIAVQAPSELTETTDDQVFPTVSGSTTDSASPITAEEASGPNTADPSREITFEERKVTN